MCATPDFLSRTPRDLAGCRLQWLTFPSHYKPARRRNSFPSNPFRHASPSGRVRIIRHAVACPGELFLPCSKQSAPAVSLLTTHLHASGAHVALWEQQGVSFFDSDAIM